MRTWRYLPYEVHSGAVNMGVDEAILQAMAQNEQKLPTLRFYGWHPAALSLGYAQSYFKEVNEEVISKRGLDVIRRPTGGRAILHQYELTYSVIAPEADENVAGTIIESYLKISQALLEGFKDLGIPVAMAKGEMRDGDSAACFDSPSWYELVVEGRKLVGSAQLRKDGVLLQHGSIIFHFDVPLLFSVLKFPSEQVREKFRLSFMKKACALDEVWNRPFQMAELEQAICDGFRQVTKMNLVSGYLTEKEKQLSVDLITKYSSQKWTQMR